MKSIIDVALPVLAIFTMFIVGLELTHADFRCIGRQPRAMCAGLVGQALVLPAVALALVLLIPLPPAMATGLLLIAACPGGGISNYYAYMVRAHVALSVALTAASCLVAPVVFPLVVYGYEQILGQAFGYRIPLPLLLWQLLIMICLPILAGMLVRRYQANWARRAEPRLRRLSLWLLAGLIGLIIYHNAAHFGHTMLQASPVAVALIGLTALAGYATGYLSRLSPGDRLTLAIEFPVRNLIIAITIAVTVFDQLEFAVFGVVYFLTEAVIMFILLGACQYRKPANRPFSG